MLLWKDIPPQHFETIFGEYPAHKPRPPMECHPVGLAHEPAPGAEKWRLRPDSTLEVLYPEFQEVVEGGWRNKVRPGAFDISADWQETAGPLSGMRREAGHCPSLGFCGCRHLCRGK